MEEKKRVVSLKNVAYVFHANKIFTLSSDNAEKEQDNYWHKFFSEFSSINIDLFKSDT